MSRRLAALAVLALLTVALGSTSPAGAGPGQDVPGLAPPVEAGALVRTPRADRAPTPKVSDGDLADWTGTGTGIAGSTIHSSGELIYEDFVFDAYGADDGLDATLHAVAASLTDVDPALDRPTRAPRMAGILLNQYAPGSRPMHAGDATTPPGRTEAADLVEARIAADSDGLAILVRTGQMRQAGDTAVVVLLDLDGTDAAPRSVPFGTQLSTRRADLAVLLTAAGARTVDLRDGHADPAGSVAVDPTGFTNAIEARIPLPDDATSIGIALATGYADAAGTGLVDVGPGDTANLVNVAFRREPVTDSMDDAQALMLTQGTIDGAFAPVDIGALRRGATETAQPGPGYYEARFTSTTPGVATEDLPRQGAFQHYALYVPAAWRPGQLVPTTVWLHYGSGSTHHLGSFQAGLVDELGEARGNLLVGPSGRGELTFYGGAGYADVLEVLADSERFGRDPDRTSLAGYSMGSYGTVLLTTLHPDLWAGALGMDGTPPSTFDGWTQNLANAAAVPFVLMGGGAHLQMRPDYVALRDAGATARLYLYPVDHFGNVILDTWEELTGALGQRVRDRSPEHVRYTRVPAIERAVARGELGGIAGVRTNPAVVTVDADGAFWLDGIEPRAGDPASLATTATVDATTGGHGSQRRTAVPESALTAEGAVAPYVMEGVRYEPVGDRLPRTSTFTAALTNVASVHFDLDRMGLCTGELITGSVTTDGPSTLHLDRPGQPALVVQLPAAGTHRVAATCGAPAVMDSEHPRPVASRPIASLPATGSSRPLATVALAMIATAGLLAVQRRARPA